MAPTCGWPLSGGRDGQHCGQPAHAAYVVLTRDIPLVDVDAPPREQALLLCSEHNPPWGVDIPDQGDT